MTESEYAERSALVSGAVIASAEAAPCPLTLCERAGVGVVWALGAAIAVVLIMAMLSWP